MVVETDLAPFGNTGLTIEVGFMVCAGPQQIGSGWHQVAVLLAQTWHPQLAWADDIPRAEGVMWAVRLSGVTNVAEVPALVKFTSFISGELAVLGEPAFSERPERR
jgi:hypothetical protein